MAETSTRTLLEQVRALLAKPEQWTQNAFARNRYGEGVDPLDSCAVCWCLRGASMAAGWPSGDLAETLGFSSTFHCMDWQDDPLRTHAEILERLDQAIQRAETT